MIYHETGKLVPFDEFTERVGISHNDLKNIQNFLKESSMPFKVTEHYTQLIEKEKCQKIKSQLINIVIPPEGIKPFVGRFDPYGNTESRKEGTSYIQHKYSPTLLVHIVDNCLANCQFCYKTREIREEQDSKNSRINEKLSEAVKYLNNHEEIDNVLLSGGDPAILSSEQLIEIIGKLLEPKNIKTIRFATKGLTYNPKRFRDDKLLDFFRDVNFKKNKINIIAHYNHPAEIDEESAKSLKELQKAGVHIYGQPVILRTVNDDVDTLINLQNKFLENNIQSYYLVTFMPIKGVEQYALPLEEVFKIVAESKEELNGLAKKGMLIAPHNWGKLEICGFLPSPENPERIILKWHEIAMNEYLPKEFRGMKAEDIMELNFKKNSIYCIDNLFKYDNLPNIE